MVDLPNAEQDLVNANAMQAAAALNVATLRYAASRSHDEIMPGGVAALDAIDLPDRQLSAINSAPESDDRAMVFIVHHDEPARAALCHMLEMNGMRAEAFTDVATFLGVRRRHDNVCLLADTALGDPDTLALLVQLNTDANPTPVIIMADTSDVATAVSAMKAGAFDFIDKPVAPDALVASINNALKSARVVSDTAVDQGTEDWQEPHPFASLTARQRQILTMVLAGQPSKNIAADLGISQRTVENHRAAIMQKSGSKSLPALTRLALAAGDPRPN